MVLFPFEPGDGVSYRVLFGRVQSGTPLIPFYVVFGLGEAGDALVTLVLDTEVLSFERFCARWETVAFLQAEHGPTYMLDLAWVLFCALTGRAQDRSLPGWREDWRQQLPAAAMG